MKKINLIIILMLVTAIAITSCKIKMPPEKSEAPQPTPNPAQSQMQGSNQETDITLRFAVMADSRGLDNGINSDIVTKTLEEIKKISSPPSFAVMPGDLVEGAGSYSEVKAQLLHFKGVITKFYPIDFFYPGFGNHEAEAGIKAEQAFDEVFSEIKANFLEGYYKTTYYFDKNNDRFYMLNSNHLNEGHQISDTQLNWIKANGVSDKNRNIYFFHEPAYPTGAHLGSSLDANMLQRDKLWTLIDNSKNPLVFCGHEHNYTRRHISSVFNETLGSQAFSFNKLVYQITTGTFGAPVYSGYKDKRNVDVPPIMEYHFAIVDVSEPKVKVTVYNLQGKILDYFEQ